MKQIHLRNGRGWSELKRTSCLHGGILSISSLRGLLGIPLVCWTMLGQPAGDLPFSSGSTGADGNLFGLGTPFAPARYEHRMAFDAARAQMVLFGGDTPIGKASDTWLGDVSGWVKANPAHSPSGRSTHAMAFDAARQEVLLFGGSNNETWVWDGADWTLKNPAQKPPDGFSYGIAYDGARQEIVLFGLSGTWIWNGTTWAKRTPAHAPSARYFSALAYDEARQVVVLFSGAPPSQLGLDETWTWDGLDWTQRFPTASPGGRYGHQIVYDAARQKVVLFGGHTGPKNDTWTWDGSNWTQVNLAAPPSGRAAFSAAYDSVRQQVLIAGGTPFTDDTWAWDGSIWRPVSGTSLVGTLTFDCSTKPDGIWNFKTIFIPAGVIVRFINSRGNRPVYWRATGQVDIQGTIDLSGGNGMVGSLSSSPPAGGPGGFSGGQAGVPSFSGSPFAGGPGQGPGGGSPGMTSGQGGQPGTYASAYGNVFIQPLIGGSGGGGSASTVGTWGNSGGGGGGAILISSSRDISLSGSILAKGGAGLVGSGAGSGGAIKLSGDRITITPTGRLDVSNDGRIRLESYERDIRGTITPSLPANTVITAPVGQLTGPTPALLIESVAGQIVDPPPRGDLQNPDVIFTANGDITVTVRGQNVPDGTPVRLRITMTGQVINKPGAGEPNVVLAGGRADFTLTVPKGKGTVQSFCEFNVGN